MSFRKLLEELEPKLEPQNELFGILITDETKAKTRKLIATIINNVPDSMQSIYYIKKNLQSEAKKANKDVQKLLSKVIDYITDAIKRGNDKAIQKKYLLKQIPNLV